MSGNTVGIGNYVPEVIYTCIMCVLILIQCGRLFCCIQKIKNTNLYSYVLSSTIMSGIMLFLILLFAGVAGAGLFGENKHIKISLNVILMIYFVIIQGFSKSIILQVYNLVEKTQGKNESHFQLLKELYALEISTQCVNTLASMILIGLVFYNQFGCGEKADSTSETSSASFRLRTVVYTTALVFSCISLGTVVKLFTTCNTSVTTLDYDRMFYVYIAFSFMVMILLSLSFLGFKVCKKKLAA